jgi:hypothetical protein
MENAHTNMFTYSLFDFDGTYNFVSAVLQLYQSIARLAGF